MFPAVIADDHGSHAERIVFSKLRDETPPDWKAIHSLGLAHHSSKPWAEIDFVVITDAGVLCLEVKGGHIEHRQGEWLTNGKPLKGSPFTQAGSGAAALFDYLSSREHAVRRAFVGYGVLFPQSRFEGDMPAVAHELIYDDRDLTAPISTYLERLTSYWQRRIHEDHGRTPQPLTTAERGRVLHELAPDFDLVPTLRSRISEVGDELVRLTERQKELLDGLVDEPRVLVKGGAGTGKTLLAREEAVRLGRLGNKTLLVCYGSRLAAHLRSTTRSEPVVTAHLHGLMSELIDEAQLRDQLPAVEPRDLFDIYYPQLAIDALANLDRLGEFDAIIIDEGQDLLKAPYVRFFDALLAGETTAGTWRIFYDPNQDIFLGSAPAELDRLDELGAGYRLTRNCRNTREIAFATSLLSGVRLAETLAVDGPDVDEGWGHTERDLERAAARILRKWLDAGLEPDQIVVLSPLGFERSIVSNLGKHVPRSILPMADTDGAVNSIRHCTIQGFKGLEADAVLLVDIDDLANPDRAALLYAASTRARTVLGVVLAESCRDVYVERVSDLVADLAQ